MSVSRLNAAKRASVAGTFSHLPFRSAMPAAFVKWR